MIRSITTKSILWIITFTVLQVLSVIECDAEDANFKRVIPNDRFFDRQVSFSSPGKAITFDRLSNSSGVVELKTVSGIDHNLTRAWTYSTGSPAIIVALLDDGFAYWHEDVRENIWHNPGETGVDTEGYPKNSNGVDDDSNGYVDDVIGWDFPFDDPDPDGYIFEGRRDNRIQPYMHSIPAMGIIGARGNNSIGVAGINWYVSMMLLKIGAQGTTLDPDGANRIEWAAQAIRYAVANGARVINWSGFVLSTDPQVLSPLQEAIDEAEQVGVLLVVGAGNQLKNIDDPPNTVFPACFKNKNIISVAEADFDGSLYVVPEDDPIFIGGSNYGKENVDIAALAQNYTTGIRNNISTYRLAGGTSNACPVVSGVAALILSASPRLTAQEVKDILLHTSLRVPALKGKVACGGIVDAGSALEQVHRLAAHK
jgi:subtilisin family serine protease